MWCPEGYVSMHSLLRLVYQLSDIYYDSLDVDYGSALNNGDEDYLEEEYWEDFWQLNGMITSSSERKLVSARGEAFCTWMIAKLLIRLNPRVSSPLGVIMKPSDVLFFHSTSIGFAQWDKHATDPILSRIITEAAFGDGSVNLLDGFYSFSIPEGIVSPSTEISKQMLRRLTGKPFDELQDQFAGWAICFPESDVPGNLSELIEFLRLEAIDFLVEEEPAPNERLKFIYDCLLDAYPNGKADTWAVVSKKIGSSRRDINRALDVFDPAKKWAKYMGE